MRVPFFHFVITLMLSASTAVGYAVEKQAVNLAPSAKLAYQVKANYSGFPLQGEATVAWQVTGKSPHQTYSIKTETHSALLGKILEAHSYGAVDAFGIAPHRYEEKALRKTAFSTTFDRDIKKIIYSESDQQSPLKEGIQDRTSAIWQLVSLARGSTKQFVAKSRWAFVVAGRRDAEKWTFSVEKNMTLPTSFGKMATVHLSKVRTHAQEQRIDIWLAPSMEWYPVRIRFLDANGDTIEQNLVKITPNNT